MGSGSINMSPVGRSRISMAVRSNPMKSPWHWQICSAKRTAGSSSCGELAVMIALFWAMLHPSWMRRAIVVFTDITERVRAEEALRPSEVRALRSEVRLKKAQAIAHVGDWIWNVKAGQVEWSVEMYRIFGIDKNLYSGRLGNAIAQVIHRTICILSSHPMLQFLRSRNRWNTGSFGQMDRLNTLPPRQAT